MSSGCAAAPVEEMMNFGLSVVEVPSVALGDDARARSIEEGGRVDGRDL